MTKGATQAIRALQSAGIEFRVHTYDVGESDLSYGEAVAAAVGCAPERVFKTLVAEVDDRPVVGIVPVAGQLSMKGLARAAGGKRAHMAAAADAERLTGYVVGGISPFGQRRRLPMFLDTSASHHDTILVSGGQRGIQVELRPEDLRRVTEAQAAPIAG